MALAIYYEDLIRSGHVHDYAELATLGHVTRARVTQIMNLLCWLQTFRNNYSRWTASSTGEIRCVCVSSST